MRMVEKGDTFHPCFSCFLNPLWEIDDTGAAENSPADSKSMYNQLEDRERKKTEIEDLSLVFWLFNVTIAKSECFWFIILMKTSLIVILRVHDISQL